MYFEQQQFIFQNRMSADISGIQSSVSSPIALSDPLKSLFADMQVEDNYLDAHQERSVPKETMEPSREVFTHIIEARPANIWTAIAETEYNIGIELRDRAYSMVYVQ